MYTIALLICIALLLVGTVWTIQGERELRQRNRCQHVDRGGHCTVVGRGPGAA